MRSAESAEKFITLDSVQSCASCTETSGNPRAIPFFFFGADLSCTSPDTLSFLIASFWEALYGCVWRYSVLCRSRWHLIF